MPFVKFTVGDTLVFKKRPPCGTDSFRVLHGGTDVKIKCIGCGREMILSREAVEKSIKKVLYLNDGNTL